MGSIEVLSPLPLFLRSLKTSKMCINPRVRTKVRVRVRGIGLGLELGFIHIFWVLKK